MNAADLDKLWNRSERARNERRKRARYVAGDHDVFSSQSERLDGGVDATVCQNWVAQVVAQHAAFLCGSPISYTLPESATAGEHDAQTYLASLYKRQRLGAADLLNLSQSIAQGFSVETVSFDPALDDVAVSGGTSPLEWLLLDDSKGNLVIAVHRACFEAGDFFEGAIVEKRFERMTVYDPSTVTVYEKSDKEWVQVSLSAHGFGIVPIIEYRVGQCRDEFFIDKPMLSLQDAYNTLTSTEMDDVQNHVRALLRVSPTMDLFKREVLREAIYDENGQLVQAELLDEPMSAKIKKFKMIPDPEADYISAGNDRDLYEHAESTLRRLIHQAGRILDMERLASASGTVSGIALRLMFAPLLTQSSFFSSHFEVGLRRRLELVNIINGKLGRPIIPVEAIEIQFNRSMPNELTELLRILPVADLLSARDMVSLLPGLDPSKVIANKQAEDEASKPAPLKAPAPQAPAPAAPTMPRD